jgi:UDP-N-acetylmuramyl pentapeptide phosphotransferase/UDP-N-acetylglucosamine-1-phosphate transferase
MFEYGLPFLLGVGFSLALTPLSRRLALRIGAIDKPGERHIHAVATPRLGGPAILTALVLALLFASILDRFAGAMLWSQWRRLSWLAAGALMVTLVGAIDDVRPLRPITKLLVEVAAASVAAYGGYRIDSIAVYHLGLLSFPLSVFVIVTAVNAVNLVDGLDGLAVGLCLIISSTLLLLYLLSGQMEPPLMLAALCGVLLGFLRYNFHPARIFLGDSGALLLGFMVGVSAISTSHQMAGTAAILAPFLALGLPLAELMLTTIRRVLRAARVVRLEEDIKRYQFLFMGRPALFSADRDHIHHRLLSFGISHRRAVLLLYGVSVAICAAACVFASRADVHQAPLLAAIIIGCVAGVRWLGYRELMPLRSGLLLPLLESRALRRKAFHVMADVFVIIASYALAFVIEGDLNRAARDLFFATLPLIAASQMAAFVISGLYRRSWRYAGIDDAIAVITALAFAAAAEALAAMLIPSLRIGLPVIILDAYLLATMVLGTRLSFRVLDHLFERERPDARRVLIYEAGRAGTVALNEIRANPALGMTAVGFLDDDLRECGGKLKGVTVYHVASVTELIRVGAFDLMVLAIAQIKLARAQMLTEQCRRAGLEVVRFEIDWQGAAPDGGLETAPRRSAAVVPIRSAGAPH